MSKHVIAGRYELIEKIGDGGMAVVYKARCRVLNRNVAIKILKPEFTKDEKFIDNFRKESHAAASLNDTNIVNIYDVGAEGSINYIVMELVEGMTLSDRIAAEGALPVDEALDIAQQIAKGLSAAHKQRIIHRDIKPQNILITDDGTAKITDFGIAKAVTGTTIVDKTNDTIMGSVHYFSPEQARGSYVDERTDIYSLGIMLFEMITGTVPFDGDNPVAIALMQINDPMPRPSEFVRGLPAAVENIILKATEKYPNKRFDNIEEMRKALNTPMKASIARGGGDDFLKTSKIDYMENRKKYMPDDENDDEFDEERPKNMKSRKRGKKLPIVIGLILLIIAGGFAAAYFGGLFEEQVKQVEVPKFVGMDYNKANAKATELNIKLEISERRYSEDEKENVILEQDPADGTKIKAGETVTVIVSKGSESTNVPNVIGKNKDEAERILEKAGFGVTIVEVENLKPEGTVIRQTPHGGDSVKIGSRVRIFVSNGKGKKKVKVPTLLNMNYEQARKLLQELNLKIEKVGEGYSGKFKKGEIMSQSPQPGQKVEEGTTIRVKINKGSFSSKSYYIDYDEAENEVFSLTVTLEDENGKRTLIKDAQRRKDKGGELIRFKGMGEAVITIYFDGKQVDQQHIDFSEEDAD